MKILGWMHRKFRSSEPLKDLSIGNPCNCLTSQPSLDDLQYYPKSNSAPKPFGKASREIHRRNSFAGFEDDFEEDSSSVANSELFHGFLTIGTLGSDPLITDPSSTPTFSISVENIAEKETEVTEDDLKMINDELEKVLGNEEGMEEESPGRNSHCSTITLSGKPYVDTDISGNGAIICPLQGYLFGSAIELPETTATRKENRASLGELFQRTMIEEENFIDTSGGEDRRKVKGNDKSAIRVMKNMIKKKMAHVSSRNSTLDNEKNVESTSNNKKLSKILRIFHRKIYPEALQKSDKPPIIEIENNIEYERRNKNGDHMLPEDDGKSEGCFKNHYNKPRATMGRRDSSGNRECWIKTDSDYLVLEL